MKPTYCSVNEETSLQNSCSKKNKDYTRGSWTKEEDDLLLYYIEKLGTKKWSKIAEYIPNRIGKQCRARWHNHLDPKVKKEWWSPKEEKIIIETQAKLGNQW